MPGKPLRWRRSGKPWRGETAASGRQVAHRLFPVYCGPCFSPLRKLFQVFHCNRQHVGGARPLHQDIRQTYIAEPAITAPSIYEVVGAAAPE